jgi:hypothetical protein
MTRSGNLGLGVTPSAWGGSFKAFQLPVGSSLSAHPTVPVTYLNSNSYFNGTNNIYTTSNYASRFITDGYNGGFAWQVAPSWNGTGSDIISFTQAMTLDASGNLLVGTTSPLITGKVSVVGNIYGQGEVAAYDTSKQLLRMRMDSSVARLEATFFSGASGAYTPLAFSTSDVERARISSDGTFRVKGAGTAGSTDAFQVAGTAPADAARIDSSGNMRIGTTSHLLASNRRLTVLGQAGGEFVASGTTGEPCVDMWQQATSGDNVFTSFYTEASFTARGSISYNRAGGLVAYNTTSDYRAKDILGPVVGSGALIDSVPVYMGKMKDATQERPMFIAHETPAYAHTGVKDAVDADGKPVYQQMDASALIPVMWAEIQSLRQRLAAAGI